jgi:hypothetical protein
MPLFGKRKEPSERDRKIAELTRFYRLVLIPSAVVEIVDNLMPDEEIKIVIKGIADSAIVATQHRAFIYKRGTAGGVTGGSKLISWDLDAIHGVQLEFGRRTGFVALQTPNAAVADLSTWVNSSDSPQRAPNAIAIDKSNVEYARQHVIELRHLLFARKNPKPSSPEVIG